MADGSPSTKPGPELQDDGPAVVEPVGGPDEEIVLLEDGTRVRKIRCEHPWG